MESNKTSKAHTSVEEMRPYMSQFSDSSGMSEAIKAAFSAYDAILRIGQDAAKSGLTKKEEAILSYSFAFTPANRVFIAVLIAAVEAAQKIDKIEFGTRGYTKVEKLRYPMMQFPHGPGPSEVVKAAFDAYDTINKIQDSRDVNIDIDDVLAILAHEFEPTPANKAFVAVLTAAVEAAQAK